MSNDQTPPDQATEELNRELRAREFDSLNSFLQKGEEATLKTAENSIRIVLLINGGAAVSVLAFVGSLASKDRATPAQLNEVARSLVWFGSGVVSSALTAFFFYLTNLLYLFAAVARGRQLAFPYVVPTRLSFVRQRIGRIFHALALLAALASLVLFLIGMYEVRDAIGHLV